MRCPQCGRDNPEGAQRCAGCGQPLGLTCPACGHLAPPQSRFCNACGQALGAPASFSSPASYTPPHLADKILHFRTALEGERKQVTVLFCDLVNSTMLAESLGPEAMHTLLNRFFELALAEVHRYEGTINQFLGDGFMALFGAPLAHEDHARRAVLAAWGIHERMEALGGELGSHPGVDVVIRMGLNTGPVVVGKIGDNLRMDYTAVGDTTNLAARLEQAAAPGTILLSAATARLVQGEVDLEDRGPLLVKGKAEPVTVHRLRGRPAGTRPFERQAQRGLTRFVGRDGDLQQLLAAWERARHGQGQVVSVVGEAGIGKSRLLHELQQQVGQGEAPCWEGSCFAYGDSISYLPFLDIVKAYFGLDGSTAEVDAKRQLRERLVALALDPQHVEPYLQNLLAYTVEDAVFPTLPPYLIQQRTVAALTSLVIAAARRQPLVLILEDLHWIDQATEQVVAALVDAMATAPLLLVLAYRPEYVHAWTDRAYHARVALTRLPSRSSAELVQAVLAKPYAGRVALAPLPPEQSSAMVQELLGAATPPPELAQVIAARTEGNPFFVEELTRSLLEDGVLQRQNGNYILTKPLETVDFPATVQGVLLTRIDRLNDELKEVLRVASVVGRVFSVPVLAEVVGSGAELEAALQDLEHLEFIYPTDPHPAREYSFTHVLTQEAVYATLLGPKREGCHEGIGRALESLFPERLEEYHELLAYHYARSSNLDKAVEYLDLANRKAAKANALEEAKAYFDQAMQVLDTLPDTNRNQRRRIDLLVNQAWAFQLLLKGPEYHALMNRYEATAVGLGDPGRLGTFYTCLGTCAFWLGSYEEALRTLTEAAELCHAAGRLEFAAQAYLMLEYTALYEGRYDAVFTWEKEVLALEHAANIVWVSKGPAAASMAYSYLGDWNRAVAEGEAGLRMGEQVSDNSIVSFAAWNISLAYSSQGDVARAIAYGELAVQKAPTPADTLWAQGYLAWAWCRAGEPRRAIEILAQCVAIMRAAGFVAAQNLFQPFLGEAYWRAGEYSNAKQTLEEVCELEGRGAMRFNVGSAHRLLGEVDLRTNPTQVAEPLAASHFEKAIAVLQEIHAENELALAYAGYGRLHQQLGRTEEARAYLTRALEILERLGTLIEPDQVRQALAELPDGASPGHQ